MGFWIITTAMAVLVAGFLVFSLRAVKPTAVLADVELQFYKGTCKTPNVSKHIDLFHVPLLGPFVWNSNSAV